MVGPARLEKGVIPPGTGSLGPMRYSRVLLKIARLLFRLGFGGAHSRLPRSTAKSAVSSGRFLLALRATLATQAAEHRGWILFLFHH
jgi:hypothetical protein